MNWSIKSNTIPGTFKIKKKIRKSKIILKFIKFGFSISDVINNYRLINDLQQAADVVAMPTMITNSPVKWWNNMKYKQQDT